MIKVCPSDPGYKKTFVMVLLILDHKIDNDDRILDLIEVDKFGKSKRISESYKIATFIDN